VEKVYAAREKSERNAGGLDTTANADDDGQDTNDQASPDKMVSASAPTYAESNIRTLDHNPDDIMSQPSADTDADTACDDPPPPYDPEMAMTFSAIATASANNSHTDAADAAVDRRDYNS
jgi:hypothetical protein